MDIQRKHSPRCRPTMPPDFLAEYNEIQIKALGRPTRRQQMNRYTSSSRRPGCQVQRPRCRRSEGKKLNILKPRRQMHRLVFVFFLPLIGVQHSFLQTLEYTWLSSGQSLHSSILSRWSDNPSPKPKSSHSFHVPSSCRSSQISGERGLIGGEKKWMI